MKKHVLLKITAVLTLVSMLFALSACGAKNDEPVTTQVQTAADQTEADSSQPASDSSQPEAEETKESTVRQTAAVNGAAPDLRCYVYYSSEKDYVYGADISGKCTIVMLEKGKSHQLNYFNPKKTESPITGIPVIFDFDRSQNPKCGYKYPEQLRITCDGGSFSTIIDGEETVCTGSMTLNTGYGTIYWICGKPGEKPVSKGEITAEYISGGEVITSQTAVISRGSVSPDSGDNIFYNYKIKVK